jgi:hypothetical protein
LMSRRCSSAQVEASAIDSPSSSNALTAALALGFRFRSAIRAVSRCPRRPHAQTGGGASRAASRVRATMKRKRRGVPLDRPVGITHSRVAVLTEAFRSIMIRGLRRGNERGAAR